MTNDIVSAQPIGGALSAEHYQTFELAKENDSVLGGDNIAQIRSYAAYARAQAQAIHKTIAATSGIEDVAAIKAEATETAQTFAKVGIYADQRIGEILRELPKSNRWKSDSPTGEVDTKADVIKAAGIGNRQAYDLQAMAANPDVVQAVLDKAEAEGRIPSRKQVLDAIKERDNARADAATARKVGETLKQQRDEAREDIEQYQHDVQDLQEEIAALEKQADKAYEDGYKAASRNAQPQIVTREVESEQTKNLIKRYESESKRHAEEYESLRHRYESVKSELDHVRKAQEDGVNTPLGDDFADALGELVATRHRYSHVAELADVFAEIDMLASQSLEGGRGK